MSTLEIKPGIHWVGAVDWAVRDFHGYVTPRGTTYNNFLIMDEDVTLVDAVHVDYIDVTLKSIKGLTKLEDIKNIVVNHIEPDHAGGLAEVIRLAPQATIYCTEKGLKGLDHTFDISKWNIKIVKTGDELNTGTKTLLFVETPMLHWPDSMMTYVREDKLLISQDAFGQHIASSQRFDDEFVSCLSQAELDDAVWDYYANILMPFGTLIKQKIVEITELGLEIDMIAPDHGVIWRKDAAGILGKYMDIAGGEAEERVVIVYDTMWHSTEIMARPIADGIKAEGLECRVIKLRATPNSIAIKEFWRARGCLIGSPTLNNTLFPEIGKFLVSLKGLRPKNRIVSAFGSYGWGGGAVRDILKTCGDMKLETFEPGIQVQYRPLSEDEANCFEFGREFAKKTMQYHKDLKAATK